MAVGVRQGGARCVPAGKADGIGGLVVGTHVAILLGALSVPCGANVGAPGVAPRDVRPRGWVLQMAFQMAAVFE